MFHWFPLVPTGSRNRSTGSVLRLVPHWFRLVPPPLGGNRTTWEPVSGTRRDQTNDTTTTPHQTRNREPVSHPTCQQANLDDA